VVWAWTQIREEAIVGDRTSIGQGCYVGPGVQIGSQCRIQNGALIYEPSVLGDSVFVGPGVVFTNDRFPRAINVDGSPKTSRDWQPVGVHVESGASIGARAVLVGPLRVGQWAMIGAGSVVSSDVKAFSLVAGVPAKHIGWVGRSGRRLVNRADSWVCPQTEETYEEIDGLLVLTGARG
jgi:UDP-2-acetamido-3-amino-2,3-dideoxy-glucuronate N-acetyltransferase